MHLVVVQWSEVLPDKRAISRHLDHKQDSALPDLKVKQASNMV